MRTMKRGMTGEDIRLLHAILMNAASARIRLARNRFAFPRSAAACRWRIASSRGADA